MEIKSITTLTLFLLVLMSCGSNSIVSTPPPTSGIIPPPSGYLYHGVYPGGVTGEDMVPPNVKTKYR